MGFGPSKIDYKERDFTKQPLDDQEINLLLQALPEENVIDSIETKGREKILRAMSDQKVFNIRGDNIFDYYFTNNKEAIKGCMTSQFTRDGTPCPDGKFNRMITNIPDLVQGPLREKVNLEALALDGFLANSEMYNKMLMEKMSQKSLDIFTKDGDIDINVKEFVEHSSIKSTLERAHKERKTIIPDFIEDFKGQASNLLNGFNKEAADSVKSQMPPLVFLMTLIQMKIAVQYSGSDKTKIAPNRTLYNYFSEFFDELGIGSNNIEYTLKFITFNTFKKFMDYDSKNDVKGIDLHLRDFLKLIQEFGGKEYLNSLSNFEIDTGLQEQYDTLNTSKTNLQSQFDTLNTSKTNLQSQFDTLNTSKNNLQSQFDTVKGERDTLQSQFDTLNEERKQKLEALALDSFLANPEMYNNMLKEKISQKTLDFFTKGGDINIDVKKTMEVHMFSPHFKMAYESKKSVLPQFVELLKKGKPSSLEQIKNKDFVNQLIETGNLMILYFFYVYLMIKIVLQYNSTDKKRVPNKTVYNSFSEFFNELGIEEQQFEYVLKFIAFNTFKKFMDYESNNDAKGLDILLKDSLKIVEKFIGKEYVNSLANFDFNTDRIFDYVHTIGGEPDMTVSEQLCKLYMESKGYGFTRINEKTGPSGCMFAPSNDYGNQGFYNKASTNHKCTDETECVEKRGNNTYSKRSCNGNVGGEYDCQVDGTWEQIKVKGWDRNKYGQKFDDAKNFCNTHKDCVAVAQSSPNWNWPVHTTSKFKPCNEGDNCNPKMNYHEKRECKKPIDGVWSKAIGESCEWECPGRSGIQKRTVPKFRVGGGYGCPTQNFTYNKDNKLFEGDHSDARNLHPNSTNYYCKRPSGANFGKSYAIQDKRINFKSSCSDWDEYL